MGYPWLKRNYEMHMTSRGEDGETNEILSFRLARKTVHSQNENTEQFKEYQIKEKGN